MNIFKLLYIIKNIKEFLICSNNVTRYLYYFILFVQNFSVTGIIHVSIVLPSTNRNRSLEKLTSTSIN